MTRKETPLRSLKKISIESAVYYVGECAGVSEGIEQGRARRRPLAEEGA